MEASTLRKRRLERLLGLAQAYRGWSRKELARALGRDPTKLVPGTGVPKLDLVVELSRVLDWPVGDVVAALWDERSNGKQQEQAEDFEALDRAAGDAYRAGRHQHMIDLARRAQRVAENAEQRARALNREAGAWDGLGRYTESLNVVARGLQERGVSAEFRRMMQSNLANSYYCLGGMVEARSVSQDLIDWFDENPPISKRDRKTHAFTHYVSGHAYRRLLSLEAEGQEHLALRARQDLEIAGTRYCALAEEFEDESLCSIANTCDGGVIEVDVVLGRRRAVAALDELIEGLDQVADAENALSGGLLESFGWWCIFGCNVALRHLTDERALQQYMAVFTNKADEIANLTDNWAMRERVFTMQYTRWERASGVTGFDIPHVIDLDDVRVITGTMGRFPNFRETGWRILQSAQVVDGS